MTRPGEIVLAHAFGPRYELPLPLNLFVLSGALVVVLSFLLVLRRDQPATAGHTNAATSARTVKRWLAGALLVAVGFLVTPNAVPIFDGVGSDEPYKRVGSSPAPAAVSLTVPVTGGRSGALQLRSSENGPQVLVDLAAGAFSATGGDITLSATPSKPDGTPPRGSFDGNLYRISVTPGAALLPVASQGYLFLRAAIMTKPDPVLVHRNSTTDPWVAVSTSRAGRDILSTPLMALGDYAVVRLPGAQPLGSAGLSLVRVLLIGGGILVLLTITVLVLRNPPSDEGELSVPPVPRDDRP